MPKLSEKERDMLKNVFRHMDGDGSGKLSKVEIYKAMKQVGQELSEESLNKMIDAADSDGDGLINIKEFLNVLSSAS